jgi:MoaA/NifB/PqqE/SkfB family radical SAM enzyme
MFKRLYRRFYLSMNYRAQSAFGGRLAAYARPTSIAILLTKYCNARCVHCDIWKNRRLDESATLEDWKKLLADLRRWLGPIPIHITGGEALLRPYAPEVCAEASRLGFFVEFLTNGYWKDQTRIERLARARPSRVTVSVDGIGGVHSVVRGKEDFWETTRQSLDTLQRVSRAEGTRIPIKLKTVIMHHNLEAVADVARFAQERGMEVFYQPIEQNYNAPEDPEWFERSGNWPQDVERALTVVNELEAMKQAGFPILNTAGDFAAMRQYFRDPSSNAVAVQSHVAREKKPLCSAIGNLQIEPNGEVITCFRMPPVGNIREQSVRQIWEQRPRWWKGGCCFDKCNSGEGRHDENNKGHSASAANADAPERPLL